MKIRKHSHNVIFWSIYHKPAVNIILNTETHILLNTGIKQGYPLFILNDLYLDWKPLESWYKTSLVFISPLLKYFVNGILVPYNLLVSTNVKLFTRLINWNQLVKIIISM